MMRGKTSRDRSLQVRVSDDELRRTRLAAQQRDLSLSQFVRAALRQATAEDTGGEAAA